MCGLIIFLRHTQNDDANGKHKRKQKINDIKYLAMNNSLVETFRIYCNKTTVHETLNKRFEYDTIKKKKTNKKMATNAINTFFS